MIQTEIKASQIYRDKLKIKSKRLSNNICRTEKKGKNAEKAKETFGELSCIYDVEFISFFIDKKAK
jgi:hypothetical protein